MTAIDGDVLFALGSGVRQLRGELAEALDRIDTRDREITGLHNEITILRDGKATLTARTDLLSRNLRAAEEQLARHNAAESNRLANLARLDRITLDLFEYIAEIERQGRKAKTVAAKTVLNEVALRLRVIRNPELAS